MSIYNEIGVKCLVGEETHDMTLRKVIKTSELVIEVHKLNEKITFSSVSLDFGYKRVKLIKVLLYS